jgi:cbb3-type cytochrome oxidase maturation protein
MVPFALLLGLGFITAFILAAYSGQYDDLETPAHKILTDDFIISNNTNNLLKETKQNEHNKQ